MDQKEQKITGIIFRKRTKIFLICSVVLAFLLTFPIVARVMGWDDRGVPHKIQVPCTCSWATDITFGVIADTHVNAESCRSLGDNTKENQAVVSDLNTDCKNNNCLFLVHLGDLINAPDKNNQEKYGVQQLIAFRQLWENDYPGQSGGDVAHGWCTDDPYDTYSEGHRTKFPVFPTTGNHDICACGDKWYEVVNYIADRVRGASGIIASWESDTYAWRVGQYYFIQLGLWAGSDQCGDFSRINSDKLKWLQKFLENHVGDSGLGVLIFQHFGWDGFSTNGHWWNDSQRLMEVNVLCRRDIDKKDPNAECNPYNILGIFSGHIHSPQNLDIEVYAGKDRNGNDVYFRNFSMRTSGDTRSATGFSIVHLHGQKITIRSKDRSIHPYDGREWSTYEVDIHTPPIDEWSEVKKGPFVGTYTAAGGAAIADINGNEKPDLVLMNIDKPAGINNQFWYMIGWDMDYNGNVSNGWSEVKKGPFVGANSAGGGAAIADINGNGKPDLLLMAIDNPSGANEFWYVVGWDLDASGNPKGWSEVKKGPRGFSNEDAGGGAAIADIDGDGLPDLLLMAIDNPAGANEFRYVVGWGLDINGNPDPKKGTNGWSEVKKGPIFGYENAGGGAAIADIDGNGTLDLLLMAVDKPSQANQFWYTIGWDLDAYGNPDPKKGTNGWSEVKGGPCVGWSTAGGGAAIANIDKDKKGRPDLLLMAIDKPPRINNQFTYAIGWNLDREGNATGESVGVWPPKSWRDQVIERLR